MTNSELEALRRRVDQDLRDHLQNLQQALTELRQEVREINMLKQRLSVLEQVVSINATNIINQAVKESTRSVFSILGVDVDDPESVQEYRDDQRFNNVMRNWSSKGVMALILSVCGVAGSAVTYFISRAFTDG